MASGRGARRRRAGATDRARRLRAGVGHGRRERDRDWRVAPGRNVECDCRHRHREPAHRRAAAQRPELPPARGVEPRRQRRVRRSGPGRQSPGRHRQPAVVDFGGSAREFNNYTLDGVDNTDVNFNTYIFLPSVDALEEFKVQTGVYSAEFGRAASQVNVVTKSGSNGLHGTVFEFHRDDALDARPYSFTASQAAAKKAPFKWDRVRLHGRRPGVQEPAVLHVEFRRVPRSEQGQNLFSVPSTAMRNGDFSELLASLGAVNAQRVNGPGWSSTRPSARSSATRGPVRRLPATSFLRPVWMPLPRSCSSSSGAQCRDRRAHQQLSLTAKIAR